MYEYDEVLLSLNISDFHESVKSGCYGPEVSWGCVSFFFLNNDMLIRWLHRQVSTAAGYPSVRLTAL